MHTTEQIQALWCPQARVTQIGAVETNATYNRALVKSHVPVALRSNEGGEGSAVTATMLKVETQISGAANCIAGKCAMWRWGDKSTPDMDAAARRGYCGLAGRGGRTE